MILGVYKESLPNDSYKNLYTNYVTVLEENFSDALKGLEDAVFDQSEFLKRMRFDLFEYIENLKKDESYILNPSNSFQ
jgi:translation initiation factor 2 alpha subunit (eIF-2alpha)